ncbi:glycoprotein vOX2-3 [Elephant endotheliotropic herpesvirus 2]|nr:glycoprotein vOX2-3 [Elephant endotheliotropic herpesvirus 2]
MLLLSRLLTKQTLKSYKYATPFIPNKHTCTAFTMSYLRLLVLLALSYTVYSNPIEYDYLETEGSAEAEELTGLLETDVTYVTGDEGELNATCMATDYTKPNLTWHGGDNLQNSSIITHNANGTTSITSTIYVPNPKSQLANGTLYCKVESQYGITLLNVPWNGTDTDNFFLGILGSILEQLWTTS